MTNSPASNWHNISISDPDALKFAGEQLHQAAQFLAIVGRNLLPNLPDDSNSNIGLVAAGLIGRKINGPFPFHALIDIPGFTLNLVDKDMTRLWSIDLSGKSRTEVLSELKSEVSKLGLNGSSLKFIDHYKIETPHPIESGAPFEKPQNNDLLTWYSMYSNARIILSQAASEFSQADEIRIWPHHFDIGTYIPLDENGTKAMGMGLAIPDTIIDDFYFYIYGWQKNVKIDHSEFKELSIGNWRWGDWNGAVLPYQELIAKTESNQRDEALKFFKESIQAYLSILK